MPFGVAKYYRLNDIIISPSWECIKLLWEDSAQKYDKLIAKVPVTPIAYNIIGGKEMYYAPYEKVTV